MERKNVIATHETNNKEVKVQIPAGPVTLNENVNVEILFSGKRCRWNVREVLLSFEAPYRERDTFRRTEIDRFVLVSDPPEYTELTETRSASITIPWETPRTIASVNAIASVEIVTPTDTVTYETNIDVKGPYLEAIFDAMIDLGFAPRDIECIADPTAAGPPFLQAFTFQLTDQCLRDAPDDVRLFCRFLEDGITVFVATDTDNNRFENIDRVHKPGTSIRSSEMETVRDRIESILR
ncbi:sporulation protein [Halopiger djelfimassiliensis]|uniref:sporulation protein n=1 Tax=Halopiger djelfimassiliensis TaxID=1293047 RepID=UPI0006778081|nr:sporulation protein [Halopiger djelfimassiliensis]